MDTATYPNPPRRTQTMSLIDKGIGPSEKKPQKRPQDGLMFQLNIKSSNIISSNNSAGLVTVAA